MAFLLRLAHLLLVGTLLLTAAACAKIEEPPTKAPPVGALEGTLTPAGSIEKVVLRAQGSSSGPSAVPDATGKFRFADVAPGVYSVAFTPAFGYDAPAPRSVTVAADATAALGTITVVAFGLSNATVSGSMSWQTGGTTYTSASLTGTLKLFNGQPMGLSLQATAQTGNVTDVAGLNLPTYNGAGLYSINFGSLNGATYLRTAGGVPTGSYSTGASGSTGTLGTITIASHNATARTITGTFGYTAYERSTPITISNGAFSLNY